MWCLSQEVGQWLSSWDMADVCWLSFEPWLRNGTLKPHGMMPYSRTPKVLRDYRAAIMDSLIENFKRAIANSNRPLQHTGQDTPLTGN